MPFFWIKLIFIFLILNVFFSGAQSEEFSVPPLTGPVIDGAKLLSSSTQNELSSIIIALKKENRAQIQVLTVPHLGGLSIEQASIQIVDQWKLGDAQLDNGVLLLIARDERRIRIEVGQGLEGDLPDAYAKRIITEDIRPFFKSGDFNSGVSVGVFKIAQFLYPDVHLDDFFKEIKNEVSSSSTDPLGWGKVLFFLVLFFFVGLNRFGLLGPLLLMGMTGGFSGGRRSGGFGSGGGRWSGGGGGFSGGGASGGW